MDRFQKGAERLHVGKERKKWVRNQFLSVPFRKRTIGAYGPFFEQNGNSIQEDLESENRSRFKKLLRIYHLQILIVLYNNLNSGKSQN